MTANTRQFYINGTWVDPVVPCDFPVENPATEEIVATISLGSAADVDRAVAAARAAFETYSQSTREERLALLERLLEVYMDRSDEMAEAISTEMGAPVSLSKQSQVESGRGNLQAAIDALREFAFEEELGSARVVREPIGVCGLITPWNWPMNQIVSKVAPALATGCTMILKPSEIAPLSGLLWTEIVHQAGIPKGVYNMINGDGPGVGVALASHPGIDLVSFTGSTRAGISVAKNAADTVKRVTQELGGKSPNIILEDADLERAVTRGVRHCFNNTGQSCNAPTRMLVPQTRYAEAVEIARTVAEQTAVGNPRDEGRHLGPLVSRAQFDKVQGLIQKGVDEGARLVAGGPGRPAGFEHGHFVRPTVFADVRNDMTIAREEIFGPVLALIPYSDDADAIRIANDTPYGLAAYVEGGDLEHARGVAARLKAGAVAVNGAGGGYDRPFGGYKQSGNGREGGRYGFDDYLETKVINGYTA